MQIFTQSEDGSQQMHHSQSDSLTLAIPSTSAEYNKKDDNENLRRDTSYSCLQNKCVYCTKQLERRRKASTSTVDVNCIKIASLKEYSGYCHTKDNDDENNCLLENVAERRKCPKYAQGTRICSAKKNAHKLWPKNNNKDFQSETNCSIFSQRQQDEDNMKSLVPSPLPSCQKLTSCLEPEFASIICRTFQKSLTYFPFKKIVVKKGNVDEESRTTFDNKNIKATKYAERRQQSLKRERRRCLYKMPLMSSKMLLSLITLITFRLSFTQNTGRCYSFGSGNTIRGAEYRRDYNIDRKMCSEVCQFDSCCMAYEYQKDGGICTLKTRSLNGSVIPTGNSEISFGLCLDYDAERDRLWDHVISGTIVASFPQVPREKCADLCRSTNADPQLNSIAAESKKWANRLKRMIGRQQHQRMFRQDAGSPAAASSDGSENSAAKIPAKKQLPAIIYSWKINDERDGEESSGTCACISVLQSVGLSFGSFSGFLI